ncbi:MAG: hypothetical protein OXL34_04590 [Gemmatimonadota bacterium]|nr:hypothetical protein [Gemmatimonadota bacterium]
MKTRRRWRLAALVAFLAVAATLDGTGQTRSDNPRAVAGEVGRGPPQTTSRELILEREVYTYPARGRRDPFRPSDLPSHGNPGTEAITLLGIIHHPDPAYRMAVIRLRRGLRGIAGADADPAARAVSRLRSGEVRGGLRIVAIEVDRVVVEMDEQAGTATRVLTLPRTPRKGES